MRSTIQLVEIASPDDALDMARCRNRVRTFMTHNTGEIDPQQQLEWYKTTYLPSRAKSEMLGYVLRSVHDPIGYGLITTREGRLWVSGGINEEVRGQGIGRLLFDNLTTIGHGLLGRNEVWLDVQRGNERAQALYRSLGYRVVRDSADTLVMVHKEVSNV